MEYCFKRKENNVIYFYDFKADMFPPFSLLLFISSHLVVNVKLEFSAVFIFFLITANVKCWSIGISDLFYTKFENFDFYEVDGVQTRKEMVHNNLFIYWACCR